MNAFPMLLRCRQLQGNFQNNAESAELWQQLTNAGLISTERVEDRGERFVDEQARFERDHGTALDSTEIEAHRFDETFWRSG